MVRATLIVALLSVLIILSLIGVIVFQQFEILSLQIKNEEPSGISEFSSSFLIRDADFTLPISQNAFWEVEAWNRNPDSVCEIADGVLHLFYNGTSTYTYRNSGVLQGRHADGRFTNQSLLIGSSPEDSFTGEYVIFPRNLSIGKLWLETKLKIVNMGFKLAS